MKTQASLLGLALVTAMGVSATVSAQDARLDPQSRVDAANAAEQAVDDAHAARDAAEIAGEAAREAKAMEAGALTAHGAAIAADAASVADQSAVEAREASNLAWSQELRGRRQPARTRGGRGTRCRDRGRTRWQPLR